MFKRIAHVCLHTKDLSKSVEYYTKLGFTVSFKFTRNGNDFGVYLEMAPGNFIEIFEDRNLGPVVNNRIAHFCLETESIDSVIEQLSAAQVPFTPKKLGCDGTWQIWLTDPDGTQFEVHQYTGKSMQLIGGGSIEADW
jgi:lactoylglutathione lyase